MRDADALVTLFGRSCGKITVSTKSVLKTTSRLAGITQPFNHLHAILYAKQDDQEIWTLTQTALIASFEGIQNGIQKMTCASCLVEWVEALSAESQSSVRVWNLLMEAFNRWNRQDPSREELAYYIYHLLVDAGLQPQILHCLQCGEENAPSWSYRSKDGGIVCSKCGGAGLSLCHGSIQILRRMASSHQPPSIRCSLQQNQEIGRLLQAHGEYHAGLQSRSVDFLDKIDNSLNTQPAR